MCVSSAVGIRSASLCAGLSAQEHTLDVRLCHLRRPRHQTGAEQRSVCRVQYTHTHNTYSESIYMEFISVRPSCKVGRPPCKANTLPRPEWDVMRSLHNMCTALHCRGNQVQADSPGPVDEQNGLICKHIYISYHQKI